ncbi:MAG: dihydroorotate dehydrogenase [Vezdaea aestivalis]|nr:MAG: dihydroorotate dehydrogenase [Vezdaea aestivalis]
MNDATHALDFDPPIINSAGPWATTIANLRAIHDHSNVGAITTRTVCLEPFPHDDRLHQYAFFHPDFDPVVRREDENASVSASGISSLNSLAYSPIAFGNMIDIIEAWEERYKPIIVSVTGSPEEVNQMLDGLEGLALKQATAKIFMEINLSCPNVPGNPPPGYDMAQFKEYTRTLRTSTAIGVGFKLPPYTFERQFDDLVALLKSAPKSQIMFLTSTNTLGSALALNDLSVPVIASATGTGIGGLAGASLHPLALGNVAILGRKLTEHDETKHIKIIGVGGVHDSGGARRMLAAGANVVGIGTAIGVYGPKLLGEIRLRPKIDPAS